MSAAVKVKRNGVPINRKRDIDNTILNSFWELADNSDDKRIKGAEQILTTLSARQRDAEIVNEPCKELQYVIKRLLRGLASTRKCARQGFSVVLNGILRQYHLFSVSDVLKMVNENLKVVKAEAKSEITGTLFGRVLAYVTIIQSELIKKATGTEVNNLVKALLALRHRKPILKPVCSKGLAQLIAMIDKETFIEHVWPQIEVELNGGWADCGPDTLLLLLAAVESKHAGKVFLTEHWDCKKLMHKENMEHFTTIIVQSATIYQVLHPVCEELAVAALNCGDKFFADFWDRVICDGVLELFSSNRKLLCINLASRTFDFICNADQIKAVLSVKFMACVIHPSSVKHDKTKEAIQQLLLTLTNFVAKCTDSDAQMTVLTCLISPPSSIMFDNVTRSKTVTSVISKMNAGACKLLADYLMNMIRSHEVLPDVETNSLSVDTRLNWAVMTLSLLVTHPALINDCDWQQSIVQFLFTAAFFNVKMLVASVPHCDKLFSTPCSDKLRLSFRDAFLRSLNKLATFNPDKEKVSHSHCLFVDCLHRLTGYAQTLLGLTAAQCELLVPQFDETARQSWTDMMTIVEKIRAKSKEDQTVNDCSLAFQLLFLHSGFHLFLEPAASCDVLQELQLCYENVTKKKRRSKTSADADMEWVDVVVDLLMSQLSTEQQLTRTVVNISVVLLTPHMTSKSLQLITDVLKPKSADGILAFDDENDNMEEDDEEMEQDVSNNENDEAKSSDDSEEEEDDDENENENENDSSEEEDEEDEENMDVDDEVRAKVKTALGEAAVHSDAEESDLDDDAMFRLDNMLTAAFKSMRKGKQLDKEKELKLKHYKMRCIDLLEQFVKHTTSASKLVSLILPVLDVAVHGWQQQKESELGNRAAKILVEMCQLKKLVFDDTLTNSTLEDLLLKLIQQASKVTSFGQKPANIIASAFLFVLRISVDFENSRRSSDSSSANDKVVSNTLQKTLELLQSQIHDFCLKRSNNVNHVFMQQLLEKRPDVMWPLVETLMPYATSSEVKVFCRTQVCMWLMSVVGRKLIQDMEASKWNTFKNSVVPEILKILLETETDQIKPLYMTQVLNLLHRIFSADSKAKDFVKDNVLTDLSEKLKSLKKLSKDLRTPCNRVAGLLHCSLQPAKQKSQISKPKKEKKVKLGARKNNKRRKALNKTVDSTALVTTNGEASKPETAKKVQPSEADEVVKQIVKKRKLGSQEADTTKTSVNKKKLKK